MKCATCGKKLKRGQFDVRHGFKKWCSRICWAIAKRKEMASA